MLSFPNIKIEHNYFEVLPNVPHFPDFPYPLASAIHVDFVSTIAFDKPFDTKRLKRVN
jgi:hypothetical protein